MTPTERRVGPGPVLEQEPSIDARATGANHALVEQIAVPRRTELQRSPSPVAGWEIRQTLFEIPLGMASGSHSHPGPEVGYIVRGDVAMEFDDGSVLTLHTGDPFLIPPGVIHNARNVSTVVTKMLSTYFVDETQPFVTLY